MNLESILDQKIKSVCPIDGVSFGKLNDKSTWRIDFAKEATDEQKQAAIDVLNAFVWDESEQKKAKKQERNSKYKDDLLYKKAFRDYKINNPDSTFSDFLDYLEAQNIA